MLAAGLAQTLPAPGPDPAPTAAAHLPLRGATDLTHLGVFGGANPGQTYGQAGAELRLRSSPFWGWFGDARF